MKLLVRLLISAVVIFGVAYLSGDNLLLVDGFVAALWAALVLGIANAVVKPIIKLIAFPVTVLTLGLFSLVINAFMLYIVSWLVEGVETVGFLHTVGAALIIAIVTSVFTKIVEKD